VHSALESVVKSTFATTASKDLRLYNYLSTEVLGNLHSLLYACCDRSARGFNLAILHQLVAHIFMDV